MRSPFWNSRVLFRQRNPYSDNESQGARYQSHLPDAFVCEQVVCGLCDVEGFATLSKFWWTGEIPLSEPVCLDLSIDSMVSQDRDLRFISRERFAVPAGAMTGCIHCNRQHIASP